MPEFVMNDISEPEFSELDHFTQGYIQALFFTECDGSIYNGSFDPENGSQLPDEAGFLDIDPASLKIILADCKRFQEVHSEMLAEAYDKTMRNGMAYDDEQAGMDFWYTRNGHGVGFWDRNLGDVGERLSEAAKDYGEAYAYWEPIEGARDGEPQGIVHVN